MNISETSTNELSQEDIPLPRHGSFILVTSIASLFCLLIGICLALRELWKHAKKKGKNPNLSKSQFYPNVWKFMLIWNIGYFIAILWPAFIRVALVVSDCTLGILVYDFLDLVFTVLLDGFHTLDSSKKSKQAKLLWATMLLSSTFYILTPLISIGSYLSYIFDKKETHDWLFIARSVAFTVGSISLFALIRQTKTHVISFKPSRFLAILSIMTLSFLSNLLRYLFEQDTDNGFEYLVLSILIVPCLLPFVIAISLNAFSFTPNKRTKDVSFEDLQYHGDDDDDLEMADIHSPNEGAFVIGDEELEYGNPFLDSSAISNLPNETIFSLANEADLSEMINTSERFNEEVVQRDPVQYEDSIPADWERFDQQESKIQDDKTPLELENPFKNDKE